MVEQYLHALLPTLTKEQLLLLLQFFATTTVTVAMIFAFVYHVFLSLMQFVEQLVLFLGNRFWKEKPSPLLDSFFMLFGYTICYFVYMYLFFKFNNFLFS